MAALPGRDLYSPHFIPSAERFLPQLLKGLFLFDGSDFDTALLKGRVYPSY